MKQIMQSDINSLNLDIKHIDQTIDILNHILDTEFCSPQGRKTIQDNVNNLINVQHDLLRLSSLLKNVDTKVL